MVAEAELALVDRHAGTILAPERAGVCPGCIGRFVPLLASALFGPYAPLAGHGGVTPRHPAPGARRAGRRLSVCAHTTGSDTDKLAFDRSHRGQSSSTTTHLLL